MRQPLGLRPVHRQRTADGYRAEAALPRADIAQDHEGEAAAGKTFAAVRTFSAYADRAEFLLFEHRVHLSKDRSGRDRPFVLRGERMLHFELKGSHPCGL